MMTFMMTQKKMTRIFDEEYLENKEPLHIQNIIEIIDYEYDNIPDKRTRVYKLWKKEFNKLITAYNEKVGFKCLNFIK